MTPYGNPEADLAEQAYDYLAQIPGLNKFLPRDVQVHRSPDGQFYCVNAEAEVKMQAQRLFAAFVGGPAVIYAGLQVSNPLIRTFCHGNGCRMFSFTLHAIPSSERSARPRCAASQCTTIFIRSPSRIASFR